MRPRLSHLVACGEQIERDGLSQDHVGKVVTVEPGCADPGVNPKLFAACDSRNGWRRADTTSRLERAVLMAISVGIMCAYCEKEPGVVDYGAESLCAPCASLREWEHVIDMVQREITATEPGVISSVAPAVTPPAAVAADPFAAA